MLSIHLRRLIVWLCLFSLLMALFSSLYASYKVQREILLDNTLENNRVYARKLAVGAEAFLDAINRDLKYSARVLADMQARPDLKQQEAVRLKEQSTDYNSVAIISAAGIVTTISPYQPDLIGTSLQSPAMLNVLHSQKPQISDPFRTVSGRWIVTLSQPIFDRTGKYLGFVTGSLYLHEKNALQALLGEQYYRDGSYLYVVDRHGSLVYHPEVRRIGESVVGNAVVQATMQGEDGSQPVVNTKGVSMLAGYAVVPSTGWGIVAQRPTEAVLASLNGLMWETVTHALPFLLFSLLCIWLLAKRIASPLSQLAHATNHMDEPDAPDRIEAIDSWYLEARQIKAALLAALMKIGRRMNKLRLDSFTDSLTGLLNRRGFEEELAIGELTGTPIAVIAIDIDHFKVINDTFGHHAGDEVIQAIAAITNKYSRVDDRLARVGGEEFVMLLPNVAVEQAVIIAERIRKEVEVSSAADPHGPYAISLGVACVPMHGTSLRKVVDRADEALYEAKRTGRNRVCMAAT